MSTCCRATLADLPEATVCGVCAETLVRCTRCGAFTESRTGCCAGCVALTVSLETGLRFAAGVRGSVRLRAENRGASPVWIERVRWRSGDGAIAGERELGRPLAPGDGTVVLANDLVTDGVSRLSLAVSVLAGPSELDLFELVSGDVVVGQVREAAAGAEVHVHGPIHVSAEYGGLARVELGGARPGPVEEEVVPVEATLALTEQALRACGGDTPIVDRRTRVLWLDGKTGHYRPHFFARRPWLSLGRYARSAPPERPAEGVDLSWLPPAPSVPLTERHVREVSRSHGRLFVRDGTLWLLDVGTPNGIHVNRRPLTPHRPHALRHGDVTAPWREADNARYAGLGAWTVMFRAGEHGRARTVEFRYRSD